MDVYCKVDTREIDWEETVIIVPEILISIK